MKSRLVLCAVLLSLVTTVMAAETPKLETRLFQLLSSPSDGFKSNQTMSSTWKDSLEQLGVTWVEGSSIELVPCLNQMLIKNTPENIKKTEEIIEKFCPASPRQVEVQIYFIEYKMDDIEKLAREDKLEAEFLLALWKKGDAKLLHAPLACGVAEFKSTVKSVNEYLYPTEVDVIVGNTNSAAANAAAFAEPQNMVMREVGVILEVTPEVTADGSTIHLTLSPSVVSKPTWRTFGGALMDSLDAEKKGALEQPFFPVQNFATCFSVSNGATVMIAGGMGNEAGDKTVFAFVRARLVDTEGKPIVSRKNK